MSHDGIGRCPTGTGKQTSVACPVTRRVTYKVPKVTGVGGRRFFNGSTDSSRITCISMIKSGKKDTRIDQDKSLKSEVKRCAFGLAIEINLNCCSSL